MKTVYEAANALEAHMLADVLKQEGITAQVMGSFLPGAVGELPAAGLVRLVVEPEDFGRAREVIDRWEATQVNDSSLRTTGPGLSRTPWIWGLSGLVVGAGLCFVGLRVPVHKTEFDQNRDSLIDERWERSMAGFAVGAEIDRNFDNKIDLRYRFDEQGQLQSDERDDDFDGTFETMTTYRLNQAQRTEADTDGDRLIDSVTHFDHGVFTRMEYLEPRSGKATRVEHLRLGRLDRVDIDTDLDGVIDTREHYNALGQITSSEHLESP
jgi:Putative prokaryotic signal transducing protein